MYEFVRRGDEQAKEKRAIWFDKESGVEERWGRIGEFS